MLSISQLPSFSLTSVKSLRYPSSSSSLSLFFSFLPRVSNFVRASSGTPNLVACSPTESIIPRVNNAGLRIEETVDSVQGKIRIDSWISSRVIGVSRARVQSSIRLGLVTVNGRVIDKVSHNVKAGDEVNCTISELQPLKAEAEDIPLDIVYEDKHLLVVNKPAHMVVHPAPGNPTGTLVNGILHHCSLPYVAYSNPEEDDSEDEAYSDDEEMTSSSSYAASVRPGIVHRLDKGTTGLLVVAKDEHSHAHLAEQFKLHTIERVYVSLTTGVPSPPQGRIEIPIGRDSSNRIRMAAIPGGVSGGRARHAASRYKVIETFAGGGSALVEWRLETGRTHQIRAHAKYMGVPLLGDEVYGGTKSMALSLLQKRVSRSDQEEIIELISRLDRPCLHAIVLGFTHPCTGEIVKFSCPPPPDLAEIVGLLRRSGKENVN
ncbi:PREDICTED: RNA pseudouridine synthase 2, chloroplastic-like [Camelina sativa]|uniref:Pseudouridine synthase n=1 Tax=Camelina sativa TaxID=90675 RepID=A0ABM0SUZ0_CAMSA|nr:PREDICTED: RNA pseudouridine synthase 2, chloroplastic-like [Camelina sativa]